MLSLSVIIPAFNESKTIARVIKALIDLNTWRWKKEIIVVDDHSTDGTDRIAEGFIGKGVRVYRHKKNLGKGMAIRTGLAKASGNAVIIQDADLEYNPRDIRSMLVVMENNPGYAVYGSRFRGRHEDTIFGHKTGNLMLTALTNLLYGSSLSDMETCYKLIPTEYLKKIRLECHRFDFEPEITAKLLNLKVGILEVPIKYTKRGFSQGKKIRWWRDGVSAVWTLLKNKL